MSELYDKHDKDTNRGTEPGPTAELDKILSPELLSDGKFIHTTPRRSYMPGKGRDDTATGLYKDQFLRNSHFAANKKYLDNSSAKKDEQTLAASQSKYISMMDLKEKIIMDNSRQTNFPRGKKKVSGWAQNSSLSYIRHKSFNFVKTHKNLIPTFNDKHSSINLIGGCLTDRLSHDATNKHFLVSQKFDTNPRNQTMQNFHKKSNIDQPHTTGEQGLPDTVSGRISHNFGLINSLQNELNFKESLEKERYKDLGMASGRGIESANDVLVRRFLKTHKDGSIGDGEKRGGYLGGADRKLMSNFLRAR